MSWVCRLSKQAAKELARLPQDHRKQLAEAIEEMEEDPTSGDVRPIRSGKFKGILRKRVSFREPCRDCRYPYTHRKDLSLKDNDGQKRGPSGNSSNTKAGLARRSGFFRWFEKTAIM